MDSEDDPFMQVVLLPSGLEYHHLILKDWCEGYGLQHFCPLGSRLCTGENPVLSCALASWGLPDAPVSSPDSSLLLPHYVRLALCL